MDEQEIARLEKLKEKLIRQWMRYQDIIEEYNAKCYKLTVAIKRINEEIDAQKGNGRVAGGNGRHGNGQSTRNVGKLDKAGE